MTETVVRLAVPEDAERIVALCEMLHEENGLFPLSLAKVHALLDRAFLKQGGIVGVIGEVGNPVASIYLGLSQSVYSDTWSLVEEWNYVSPEHRHSDYARKLIAYAKACSDEIKMPLLVGILSNKRTEAKVRLYERHLEKAGAYFIYNRKYSGFDAWGAGE